MDNNDNMQELSKEDLLQLADQVTNTDSSEILDNQDPSMDEISADPTEEEVSGSKVLTPEELDEIKKRQEEFIAKDQLFTQQQGMEIGLNKDTLDSISDTFKRIEEETAETKAMLMEKGIPEEDLDKVADMNDLEVREYVNDLRRDIEEYDDENGNISEEEFNEAYKEAVIVIDKTDMGKVINFTEEERQKLEKVSKIKLEEVETISLSTLKVRKMKPANVKYDEIINKVTNIRTTDVILPLSGYRATIRGCSAHEVLNLIQYMNAQDSENTRAQWSLIYSKIDSTSIGNLTYNEFLHATANQDREVLLYGILCTTYPDVDKTQIVCQNDDCRAHIEHQYSTRSLIRSEKMNDELKERFAEIADVSYTIDRARHYHKNKSLVNTSHLVQLPETGIIVDIKIQSAYDFIERSLPRIDDKGINKPLYNSAIVSTFVNKAYIVDPDSTEDNICHYEISDMLQIIKLIYKLPDTDALILNEIASRDVDQVLEFGFMNVTCPKCGKYYPTIPVSIANLLFSIYAKKQSTKFD